VSDRHKQVRRLFTAAVERPAAERAAFLDRECDHPDVRRRVESLLRHRDVEPEFLEDASNPRRLRAPVLGENLGRYRILREIGRGGMGIVYEAYDEEGRGHVALKVMHEHLAFTTRAYQDFRREAELARRLDHPNILPVHDFGEDAGRPYIVSELSAGPSLKEALIRRRQPFPEAEGAAIVAALAEALDSAHRHGVIHRDVKPANVMLDADGAPRLTDFGRAKDVDATSISVTGDVMGSLPYMSPEQARGDGKATDGRTDVFSLGVVLYELLLGRRPFEGTTREEILHAVQFESPPGLRQADGSLSRDIALVCAKAMEKEPRYRYRTAGGLANDLRAVIAGRPVQARPPGAWRIFRERARRHARLAGAALALAVGVPAAVLVYRHVTDLRPRVAVVSVPAGAEIAVARVDPAGGSLGAEESLGRASGKRVRIGDGPGYYRIIARIDGRGAGEATRHLAEGRTDSLTIRVLPIGDVTAAMVRIDLDDPGLRERIRAAYPAFAPPERSYWIDRCEVTNAELRRYLEESGSEYRPALWPAPDSWDPAWDALPASGIPYEQAQAYAEWNGKRLPTRAEWELAARGPDAALYPWGGTERLPQLELRESANVFGDRHDIIWSGEDRFPQLASYYASSVLPAAILPPGSRDRSWAGLVHTLGNVAEWTESVPVPETPAYQLRIIKGDHWGRDLREHWSLSSHMTGGAVGGAQLGCGFRCAKSDF
jgi:hypothetical protein